MMNPLPMVGAELRQHLASSLGILVLLAFACSGTVAISLFERGLRQAGVAGSRDSDLVIGAAGSQTNLVLAAVFLQQNEALPLVDAEVLERLKNDPRVAALSPLVFADNWQGLPIIGIGRDFPSLKPALRLSSGRWPQADFELVAGSEASLVLDQQIHGAHDAGPPDPGESDSHAAQAYTVVGRLEPQYSPWDRALYTPHTGIWELHQHQGGPPEPLGVSAILVKPAGFAQAYQLKAEYSAANTTAAFPAEVLGKLFAVAGDIRAVVSLIAAAFQAMVFAAVLISILASLPARSRWIGLLRAIGAGRGYVFLVLWLQSALVFLLAALAGLLLGWLAAGSLSTWLAAKSALAIPISLGWPELLSLLAFWLMAALGSLLPALAGYRISVRQALLR